MSSNQTHLLSNKNNVGSQMPFCNPPKNPIFINTVSTSALSLPQKKYPFLFFPHLFLFPHNRIMWALLGFLSWSEFSQRKQGRREPSHFPLPLSLFLVSLLLYCFVLLPSVSLSFIISIAPISLASLFNFVCYLLLPLFLTYDEEDERDSCYGVFSICCCSRRSKNQVQAPESDAGLPRSGKGKTFPCGYS